MVCPNFGYVSSAWDEVIDDINWPPKFRGEHILDMRLSDTSLHMPIALISYG